MGAVVAADLRDPAYLRDPFPVWRRLRDEQPLFHDDLADRYILTRYDDVAAVLGSPEVYSARTYQERFRPVFGRTLAELDGPRHIRERTIVAPAFVGRSLDGYAELIDGAIERLLAEVAGLTHLDLVAVATGRLPLQVISALLGFPPSDDELLLEIGRVVLEGLADEPGLRAAGAAAHRRLCAHLDPYVEQRQREPGTDLVSRLVHAEVEGERLSPEELRSFVSFLLAAGGPTTDMALRNLWWALLEHPSELERCRDDREHLQRAISESLRRDGPIVYEDRRTNVATEWYGVTIPADTDILVCLGSANTDDSVFADPEHFDPGRADLLMGTERKPGFRDGARAGHLAFGLGSHFCMGYQLARVEMVRATEGLLLQLDRPRLTEPVEPHVTWYERTVPRLPVTTGT